MASAGDHTATCTCTTIGETLGPGGVFDSVGFCSSVGQPGRQLLLLFLLRTLDTKSQVSREDSLRAGAKRTCLFLLLELFDLARTRPLSQSFSFLVSSAFQPFALELLFPAFHCPRVGKIGSVLFVAWRSGISRLTIVVRFLL